MVNKNIQMKKKNGESWDNLFPLTFDENVYDEAGKSLKAFKQEKQQQLNQEFEEIDREFNATKINAKYPPEGYEGIKADGETNDAPALQTLIDNFNYIQLPKGTINIETTLKGKSNLHIEGAYGETIITSSVPNLTLFLANRFEDPTTDFSHSSLKNMDFNGNGYGQIGFNIRGYQSKIEKVYVRHMSEPFITGGVMMEYNDMFIINNEKGGHLLSPPTSFNTMLNFNRVEFHSNKGPLTHDSTGVNTVGLTFDTCVFEQTDGRPMIMNVYSLTIRNCWFERNTQKPLINNHRVLLERNRYEVTPNYPEQSPEWMEGTYEGVGTYRGRVEIGEKEISARTFHIQQYDAWGEEFKAFNLQATGQENERKLFTNVNDKNEYFMTSPNTDRLRVYSIKVNASGSMAYSDLEEIGVTCNRTATGVYEINFDEYIDHREVNTQVQVMPAASNTDILHTVSFNNTSNIGEYQNWYNQINVKGYELNETDPVSLTPTNVIINILFFGNEL